jgi:hypothetical protein
MARLTKEQRRELANIRDEGESDIVAAIRDLAACILRLDEEVEPVHPSHLTTVVEHLERERDEALARLASAERALSALRLACSREADELGEALARAIDERDEVLGKLVEAERYSAKVAAELVDQNFAIECERDEAIVKLVKVERERDDALAVRTSQEAWIDSLGEALASAIDERDGARAKLSDVDRLLAIEEQAKRVARAEKWLRWARTADAETDDDAWGAVVSAADTLRAERCKLAEMVGEGDET